MSSSAAELEKTQLENKADELRRLFDQAFAVPPQIPDAALVQMLAIGVRGEPYAIRVDEICGLAAPKGKILPIPSSVPELLGLTGVRGMVVPVFSLARLLGFGLPPASAASVEDRGGNEPRWAAFARASANGRGVAGGYADNRGLIALAFDEMERQFAVPSAQIYPRDAEQPGAGARRYVAETVSHGEGLRGVISISGIVEYIQARSATGARKDG